MIDVELPRGIRTLSLWHFNRKTSQNIIRTHPPNLQQIKFLGDVELNEKTLDNLTNPKLRQIYISNRGLKGLKQTIPLAFGRYLSSANLIYFGLERLDVKHADDFELMRDLVKKTRTIGNDDQPIFFDVTGVTQFNEVD